MYEKKQPTFLTGKKEVDLQNLKIELISMSKDIAHNNSNTHKNRGSIETINLSLNQFKLDIRSEVKDLRNELKTERKEEYREIISQINELRNDLLKFKEAFTLKLSTVLTKFVPIILVTGLVTLFIESPIHAIIKKF